MKVIVLTIGDEILIGQVTDTNSAWIGQNLATLGVSIHEIRSIKDEKESILSNLAYAVDNADFVIITGGLGPTKDDITKKTIAEFMGVKMVFDEPTYARIIEIYSKFGMAIKASHKDQCYMPTNAQLLTNRMGTAPGMLFEYNGVKIISMPGVPYEMKGLMAEYVLPLIAKEIPLDQKIYGRTIMTAGVGETTIESIIDPLIEPYKNTVSIAYLPSLASVRVRLTGVGELSTVKPLIDTLTDQVVQELGEIVYGLDGITLSESLMHLCNSKQLTIGTAESCTGGYVSHLITATAGSSSYYLGSTITYTNELKEQLLGVKAETLLHHGAVSEETVIQMAKGVCKLLNVDIAVSISGIAGPTGGTKEKPVGTIWLCICDNKRHHAFKINATKDRLKNIQYTGNVALNAIRKFVEKYY